MSSPTRPAGPAQPPSRTHRRWRLRRPVVVAVGLAVLATAGCSSSPAPKIGGGPEGRPSASPAEIVAPGQPAPPPAAKPNIITIVTDDMRTDDLRYMPHVRHEIAARGLDYANSFAPNPLCAPARSSLLTGQDTHNTGVYAVDPPTDYAAFDDSATIATSMNRAGYNTLFLGKYMNGYGDQNAKVTGRNSFRYVPPGWTDWYGSVQRPAHSGIASGGTYNYYNVLLNHNGVIDRGNKGRYQTVVEGRIARRLVKHYHRSPKPFFLYFAPIAPHFGSPREKRDPRNVFLPGGTPEPFKTPAVPGRYRGIFDKQIAHASGLPPDGGLSQSHAGVVLLPRPMRYLPPISRQEKAAMLSVTRQRAEALFALDQQIGKLVATLKKTGEYDDTVLMFTSDNGYFLGEHWMRQGKIWTQEPSLRVPFLASGPGIPHGTRYDPVTSADIAATVLGLGGATPPQPLDGSSLVPSFTRDRGWRTPVVLESQVMGSELNAAAQDPPHGFTAGLTGTGIRTAHWKYVRYVDGDGELYDLDKDPNELRNVYGVKRYAAVQRQLAKVWVDYRACRGVSCERPLPKRMQAGPSSLAKSTQRQQRGIEARFGVAAP